MKQDPWPGGSISEVPWIPWSKNISSKEALTCSVQMIHYAEREGAEVFVFATENFNDSSTWGTFSAVYSQQTQTSGLHKTIEVLSSINIFLICCLNQKDLLTYTFNLTVVLWDTKSFFLFKALCQFVFVATRKEINCLILINQSSFQYCSYFMDLHRWGGLYFF